MIVNRYPGKCQSCNTKLAAGNGFAYKNGYKWFKVCTSTACMKRLGLQEIEDEIKQERKLTENGIITMPFDREAIPLIKAMPGSKWNPDSKQWSVSILPKDLPRVIELADQLQLQVPDSMRTQIIVGTKASREAFERANNINVNGKILYDFQKEGVKFLALHDKALLADEMGTGKTLQALVALPKNERVLIICPASLKYNWRDEINMWRPEYKITICNGRDSFKFPDQGEIAIINYDILPSWLSPTKNSGEKTRSGKVIKIADVSDEYKTILKDTTVIADEIYLCKNWKATRSQKFGQLSRLCKNVWLLTGTPLMTRPTDLFGILSSGNMNPFGSWNKFVNLFNGFQNQWGGYEFGMPEEIVPELMKRVMLRRLKKDVLKDLPPKIYKTLEINNLGKSLIDALNKFAIQAAINQGIIEEEDVKKTKDISALVKKLELGTLPSFDQFSEIRTLIAKARIPSMIEIVESYEDSETPLVVFSSHRAPIDELKNREGWKIITGDTKSEERRDIVHEFQDGKLKGIGLTIQAGGVGLTLTRASNALFVDLDWTPAMNIQAEDRLCRIGSTGSNILITRMTSNHPLDQHMQRLIEYKMELAYKALEHGLSFKPIRKRPLAQEIEIFKETEEELINRIALAEIEANREYSLGRLQEIAGREAAKVNDIPEPKLTTKRKDMLREALEYLTSICDGAMTRDNKGFNRPDAAIGHWINGTGLRDEDDFSFRILERILCRYRKQLKEKFEAIWKPDL